MLEQLGLGTQVDTRQVDENPEGMADGVVRISKVMVFVVEM